MYSEYRNTSHFVIFELFSISTFGGCRGELVNQGFRDLEDTDHACACNYEARDRRVVVTIPEQ